ncbi:MAG: thiamine-phosphate kinase [Chloroflexi bacterium]|nr:thiamine-phosphate kinase [Chloroflexota bacterium]
MRLDELGEFGLIDRIISRLGASAATDILVPPGDDAAAWTTSAGAVVATIDALAEGTHWRADTMTLFDVAWRAVAANVSDLAAMGAEPGYLLVASALGPDVTVEALDGFADGLATACRVHNVRVAGGDIVRARSTLFSIAAFGAATLVSGEPHFLRRSGARAGDAIAVTGTPGASGAGLALINAGRADAPGGDELIEAHRRPIARARVGQQAATLGLRCAIDISDGLAQDIGHVARRSGVGIEIATAQLPLHPAAVELLGHNAALDLALGGGEDFELVLTGPRDVLRSLDSESVPVTLIGRVVAEHPGEVVIWTVDGEEYRPPSRGWDQLRPLER